ncbi:Uncharacterised protein [Serratia fonticola]|uniref:Uncharacterized protein n=1 Tax=Serratia fonticola TaxID=47917 RepID=A0A4U9UF10_SERFO|nr:Uncharacterised protein [Serratia fonticola]
MPEEVEALELQRREEAERLARQQQLSTRKKMPWRSPIRTLRLSPNVK